MTKATTAADSARDVELTVSNSIITETVASVSPTSITLHPGESAALPAATAGMLTAESWPSWSPMPVKTSGFTWTTSNAGVASLSGGKIVANKVGSATITATTTLGSSVSASASVQVEPWDIASASVASIPTQTYSGAAFKPAPVVTFNGKTLSASTDYNVAYKNNTNAGTATVTITGKGNYSGTKTATFTIKAASIANATITGLAKKTYVNKAIKQMPTVKLGSAKLVANTDYAVTFQNNKNAGTATVTVKGKGNYSGTKTATFKIVKAANTLKASVKAKTISVNYNKKKAVTLTKAKVFKVSGAKGKVTFVKKSGAKNFTVSKAGKVKIAKATKKKTYTVKVKVTAAGNSNYKKLTKTVTLKIRVK